MVPRKLEFDILPVVFTRFKCTSKVRKVNPKELLSRRFIVKECGSFQIKLTVEPFFKSIL